MRSDSLFHSLFGYSIMFDLSIFNYPIQSRYNSIRFYVTKTSWWDLEICRTVIVFCRSMCLFFPFALPCRHLTCDFLQLIINFLAVNRSMKRTHHHNPFSNSFLFYRATTSQITKFSIGNHIFAFLQDT